MAKKYHQNRKDREDESRGMERYEKRKHERRERDNYGSFVDGHDPAIGRGDFANLPQDKIVRQFPRNRMYPGGRLDDSITGIDAIQSDSEGEVMRHLSNQK